jgi:hypothetical protein
MIYELPPSEFKSFAGHLDHEVEFTAYGLNGEPPWHNLALECVTCGCVIADWSPMATRRCHAPANRKKKR